jgi:hypothetical protein
MESPLRRFVDPSVCVGARRLHGGGMAANEVPAVLLKNERVLTEAQQSNTATTIASLAAMASKKPEINISHNIQNMAPNTRARSESSWGQGGELKIDVLIEEVTSRQARDIAKGEGLAPSIQSKFGLNPAAGG